MVDIQRLIVDLQLRGNFQNGIGTAQRRLRDFTGAANRTQGTIGRLGNQLRRPELRQSILQGVGLGGGVLGFQAVSAAIGTVVDQAGQAVNAASDLVESQSKVDAVFDTQAVTIRRWADQLDASFGLTEQAALESAGTLGNFLQALGQTEDFASRASRDITELAGDLSSFNNVRVDDVLIALRSGLAGESEPVRRLGIDISVARIESLLLAEGISKVNGEFTQGQKVLGRYLAIMEDTEKAQGDAARTSDTLAGRQRQLNARFGDLQARVGGALIPVISDLAGLLLDVAASAEAAGDFIGDFAGELGKLQKPLQDAQVAAQDFVQPLNDLVGRDLVNDTTNGLRILGTGGFALVFDHAQRATDGISEYTREQEKLRKELESTNVGLVEFSNGFVGTSIATARLAGDIEDVSRGSADLVGALSGVGNRMREVIGATVAGAEAFAEFRENIDRIAETRGLRQINRELNQQRRIRDRAIEQGKVGRFLEAQANIERLREERRLRRQGRQAFREARTQQNRQREGQQGVTRSVNQSTAAVNNLGSAIRGLPSGKQIAIEVNTAFQGLGENIRTAFGGRQRGRPPGMHTGGIVEAGQTVVIRQDEALFTPSSRTEVRPLSGRDGPMNITLRSPDVIVPSASIIGGTGRSIRTSRQRAQVA